MQEEFYFVLNSIFVHSSLSSFRRFPCRQRLHDRQRRQRRPRGLDRPDLGGADGQGRARSMLRYALLGGVALGLAPGVGGSEQLLV